MALAQAVAAQHGALVTALYASAPTALSLPLAMAQSPADMLPMLQQLDIDCRDQAQARVARAGSSGHSPIQWRELCGGALAAGFAAHALFCDLLVLGQPDSADALTVAVPAGFVEAPIERHPRLALAFAGEAILSLAGDVGAGLWVMGWCGHGRAHEWVMGGASRTVLASMTLPVLMAH